MAAYEYLDAWVLRVVTNLAIDAAAVRRAKVGTAQPVEATDAVLLRVTLAQALRSLPTRQRDAVVPRYLADRLTHTYATAGTYVATFSVTLDVCGPRTSRAQVSTTVHVSAAGSG